ncbi:MAG: hypothetical protein ACLFN0_08265 [Thermovirgaceae bacterium]
MTICINFYPTPWGRIFDLLIVFNLPDNRNRSEPKTEDQASLYFEKHGNDVLRHGFNTLRDLAVHASGRHLVRGIVSISRSSLVE